MIKRITVLMVLVLLLSGCAGQAVQEVSMRDGGFSSNADFAGESFAPEAEESMALDSSLEMEKSSADLANRLVIKNANLSIVVEEPGVTMEAISELADELGGFVVSSNLFRTNTERGLEVPQANITIRVPAESLDEALEVIKSGAGQILNENVTGQDVTQEYTDLSSRLRNLERAEEQLSEIMNDAYQTEDVLSVYNRLVEVQQEIELIKGQMQYYQQAAALSAISVTIQANEAVQPLQIGGWQPVGVAKRAIQSLINTLEFFVDALIWIVLYILPVAVILFFPIRWIWRGLKRLFRGKKNKKEGQEESGDQS